MVLEMTPNGGYVKPTMKKSPTLFMSVLNFFKMNTNDDMTGWERKILQGFNIQADNIIEHRLDYYGKNQQESPNC